MKYIYPLAVVVAFGLFVLGVTHGGKEMSRVTKDLPAYEVTEITSVGSHAGDAL